MSWTKLAVFGIVACLAVTALFIRVASGWQRAGKRQMLADVDRALAALATAMRGRFQPGAVLIERHPLLGEIRDYGSAEVQVRGLELLVGVNYPSGEPEDEQTRIRVPRPPGRAWRVEALRLRAPPGRDADLDSAAAFARAFEVRPDAGAVPDPVRAALMRLAGAASELELKADTLSFVAAAEAGTVYVADLEKLRALVNQLGTVANLLLRPA
jgi:hypothetical protein